VVARSMASLSGCQRILAAAGRCPVAGRARTLRELAIRPQPVPALAMGTGLAAADQLAGVGGLHDQAAPTNTPAALATTPTSKLSRPGTSRPITGWGDPGAAGPRRSTSVVSRVGARCR
jgi:hypothetical protein